ncbi:hypothetical protein [Phenylobacterium sp.]|uniref:hypothetical protein n=1 Tax=Phenylobacterium sp. TaxID=1871053 RepID=UPI00341DB76A
MSGTPAISRLIECPGGGLTSWPPGGVSDTVSVTDPEAGWGRLIDLGSNVIMTDRPEHLLRHLERTGRRCAAPGCREMAPMPTLRRPSAFGRCR